MSDARKCTHRATSRGSPANSIALARLIRYRGSASGSSGNGETVPRLTDARENVESGYF
jgi:hypothetical protein